jgi:hypothetical protein
MKKPPSIIEKGITGIVSIVLGLIVCAVVWISMRVVWPILRFSAKFAWKHTCKALTKSKVVKPAAPKLQTPDIFKNAPNLARAKPVRF